jgi:FixJ family two-component response regulator
MVDIMAMAAPPPPSDPAQDAPTAAQTAPDAPTVLVVDDEPSNVASLEKIFQREGMRVLTADSAKTALDLARAHRVQVVLTDLMMPGVSGIELLRALKQASPDTEVVMMTAYGTVETAVQAMREGAYDFVEKPLKRMTIVKSVKKAAERQSLVTENRSLKSEIARLTGHEIVGSSPALRRVLEIATQAAPSSATVLVLGESGTGKELLARFIHEHSSRSKGPFVAVNCAAIPESDPRGRALRARARRVHRRPRPARGPLREGRRAARSSSTRSASSRRLVQVKLLRVLQEGEYEPVGGDTTRADVRIVAATNKDLRAEVARAASARTSTTASTSSRSRRRRCARAATTSRSSSTTSSASTARRTAAPGSSPRPR